ncbi:MAG: chromosome partitioning protein ParA [Alphaproteobacteria bacterium]|nr:MAG: chromosome partitioning protein ParA [Alphaproteobacteria bacterium]
MKKIISIANQKGGVGKTTTTVNLCTALAATRKKTLLIDFDPQGNSSTSLGFDSKKRYPSVYELLTDQLPLKTLCRQTLIPNLSIVTASNDLAGFEIEFSQTKNRDSVLKRRLNELNYDYIIIDCPPALGLLTINALVASQSVIIPLQCEYFALEGLSQLLQTVRLVQQHYNKSLKVQGIVLTMYDGRNALNKAVVHDVRQTMGSLVYQTVIPRNVKLSEAPSHGKPALIYDMKSAGAQAYIRLAAEIIRQERTHTS